MPLQNLVVVALRLVALNWLLSAITTLFPVMLPLISALRGGALPWLVLSGLLLAGASFWFLARPIARWVTRGCEGDVSLGALTLPDCYSLIFVGVALVNVVSHLSGTLNWIYFLLMRAGYHPGHKPDEEFSYYSVAEAIIPFILGVFLLAYSRSLALRLARAHGVPGLEGKQG